MVHLPECLGRLKEQVVMLVLRGVPGDPGSSLSPTCNASGSWRSVLEACRSTISTLHCRLWVLGVTHRIPPPKLLLTNDHIRVAQATEMDPLPILGLEVQQPRCQQAVLSEEFLPQLLTPGSQHHLWLAAISLPSLPRSLLLFW